MAPYDLRKLEEAVTSYNKALAINPDLPDTEKAQYFALQQIEELK
jgi:TPR repeat